MSRDTRAPGGALTTRHAGLDGVRGLAVFAVVGFHLYYFAGGARHAPEWTAWLAHGFLGVNLFFVLSGFLLIGPWLDTSNDGPPPPAVAFYRRRWQRLAPALYVHWLVVLFAVAPLVHGAGILASGHGWLNGIAHLLFLQQLHPGTATGLGISTALWTLSLEAQFYLLLPLLAPLFAARHQTLGMLLGALVVSLAWRGFASRYGAELGAWLEPGDFIYHLPLSAAPVGYTPALFAIFLEQQLPAYLFDFGAGMALAVWSRRWPPGGVLATTVGWAAVVALVAVVVLVRPGIPGDDPWRFLGGPLFVLAAAALIAASYRSAGLLARGLSLPPLAGLGRISYSVYLWHTTVLYLTVWFLAGRGVLVVNPFVDLILIALPAILLLAWVSYRWLERPLLGRAWRPQTVPA